MSRERFFMWSFIAAAVWCMWFLTWISGGLTLALCRHRTGIPLHLAKLLHLGLLDSTEKRRMSFSLSLQRRAKNLLAEIESNIRV
jgi:hypothetical protein